MKGHVRERGKGNWYAVLSVRDPQTGKRKVQWRSLPGCKGKARGTTGMRPNPCRDGERRLYRAGQDYCGAIP